MSLNKPVNFSIAKLLKEKGFDEPCSHAYKEVENPVLYIHQDKKYNNSFKKEWQNTIRKNSHMDNAEINRYSAPTIAEVCMWLYEKHGIWIEVRKVNYSRFDYKIINGTESLMYVKTHLHNSLLSPTEAYLAAIEYVLTKLI